MHTTTKPTTTVPTSPHVVADDLCQIMGVSFECYLRAAGLISVSGNGDVIRKAFEFALARVEQVGATAIEAAAGERSADTDSSIYRAAGRKN